MRPVKERCKDSGTGLTALPPELIRMITDHLSPSETACLALCNRLLIAVLGTEVLSALQPGAAEEEEDGEEEGDREKFLMTLTRDLPTQYFCHECSRLHLQVSAGPPGPALQPRRRLPCVASPRICELSSRLEAHPPSGGCRYLLDFSHVQLAMKRHRHGPTHGVSTKSLAYVEVYAPNKNQDTVPMTTLLSVEARIYPEPEHFCLRIQQWAVSKYADPDRLLSAVNFIRICCHVINLDFAISDLIWNKLEPHCSTIKGTVSSDVLRCNVCMLDYQVELRIFGDEGLAMVITKWLDLGAGLTPKDIRWDYFRADRCKRAIPEGPGKVRLRFESVPGLPQEALSARNASYLADERFKKVLDCWHGETWILQAGERLPFMENVKRRSDLVILLFLLLSSLWLQLYRDGLL